MKTIQIFIVCTFTTIITYDQEQKNSILKYIQEGKKVENILYHIEDKLGYIEIDLLGDQDILNQNLLRSQYQKSFRTINRMIDIIGALTLLIFTAPLSLIAAAFIKLESQGPIIYQQRRIGLIYKDTHSISYQNKN